MNRIIKYLEQPYKEMALIEQENQGNKRNEKVGLADSIEEGNFRWSRSLAGPDFWEESNMGNQPEITPEILKKFPTLKKETNEPFKEQPIINLPELTWEEKAKEIADDLIKNYHTEEQFDIIIQVKESLRYRLLTQLEKTEEEISNLEKRKKETREILDRLENI
jgi:hypothetical protein